MTRVRWGIIAAMAISGCGQSSEPDNSELANENAGPIVAELSRRVALVAPPKRILVRAFKQEKELEVWGAEGVSEPLKLIVIYRIARMSGAIGPKRKEGDYQVPEGLYAIDRFNPKSQFHLSLGLDYPNESDRVRSDSEHPGSDIFIHGGEASIGCLAMTDPVIEELWVFATTARDAGQFAVPVHIYPCRLSDKALADLERKYPNKEWHELWRELKSVYDAFEADRQFPRVVVDSNGAYQVKLGN